MKLVDVTINLPDNHKIKIIWEGVSLDVLWMDIRDRFPKVTSVVLVFVTPEDERK